MTTKIEYHDNGRMKSMVITKGNKENFQEWYPSGFMQRTGQKVSGLLYGTYYEFHDETGGVALEENYKRGALHGQRSRYSSGGETEGENFKNGILDGRYTLWYANGKEKVSGQYKNGQKVGPWQYLDPWGKFMKFETYNDDGTLRETINDPCN